LDREAQAKSLRLRMYVLCSECARLIDLAEGDRQLRDFEGVDLVVPIFLIGLLFARVV
jgi:hypothetical protein